MKKWILVLKMSASLVCYKDMLKYSPSEICSLSQLYLDMLPVLCPLWAIESTYLSTYLPTYLLVTKGQALF